MLHFRPATTSVKFRLKSPILTPGKYTNIQVYILRPIKIGESHPNHNIVYGRHTFFMYAYESVEHGSITRRVGPWFSKVGFYSGLTVVEDRNVELN